MNSVHSARTRPLLGRNLTLGLLDILGRSIVIGNYKQSRLPTEAELAEQHGVSRSVTREAVKMLTAKGLLSARPRQGTIVQPTASWNLFDRDVLRWTLERKYSLGVLRHFNQLRSAIEPEAAALAATYADDEQIKAVGEGLERMIAAQKGLDEALDSDIAFHVAVLNASGNPFYAQFSDVVATALRSSIPIMNRLHGHSASVTDHAAVRDAIKRRNPNSARLAMKKVIAEVLELIATAEKRDNKSINRRSPRRMR
ncbi:MAG TPA: FadR/GntR family transcriptional regulator [Steroidobacter sp.]|uniref:FadR/GntR family transcriptional regulator n=1 Tax=Steroidobacter sp. TaxID=1978227 RepID=UPI002EDAB3B0